MLTSRRIENSCSSIETIVLTDAGCQKHRSLRRYVFVHYDHNCVGVFITASITACRYENSIFNCTQLLITACRYENSIFNCTQLLITARAVINGWLKLLIAAFITAFRFHKCVHNRGTRQKQSFTPNNCKLNIYRNGCPGVQLRIAACSY
jgi:hypothetical protein